MGNDATVGLFLVSICCTSSRKKRWVELWKEVQNVEICSSQIRADRSRDSLGYLLKLEIGTMLNSK